VCQLLPQLAVACGVRHQKIDVHRFTVFAMAQGNAGSAAKIATVRKQRGTVQGVQHMGNALVVRAVKLHG
jgi:hypothetical protein